MGRPVGKACAAASQSFHHRLVPKPVDRDDLKAAAVREGLAQLGDVHIHCAQACVVGHAPVLVHQLAAGEDFFRVGQEFVEDGKLFTIMSSDELKKSVAKRLLVLQRSINLIQFIRLQIQHFISAFCFFMGNLL